MRRANFPDVEGNPPPRLAEAEQTRAMSLLFYVDESADDHHHFHLGLLATGAQANDLGLPAHGRLAERRSITPQAWLKKLGITIRSLR